MNGRAPRTIAPRVAFDPSRSLAEASDQPPAPALAWINSTL